VQLRSSRKIFYLNSLAIRDLSPLYSSEALSMAGTAQTSMIIAIIRDPQFPYLRFKEATV
jgi:hypothetical protein